MLRLALLALFTVLATTARAQDAGDAAAMTGKAKAMFAATAAATCDAGEFQDATPDTHAIGFRYTYDSQDDPERTAYLYRFFCFSGAYNEIHVYYISDGEGALSPLYFAEPTYDVRYRGETDEVVENIAITGFAATGQLVNSGYDSQSRTITAHSQWRGAGDASSLGVWLFADGGFRLVRYEVDASYDGEINPQTLLDHSAAP